jgi:ribosome-associated toxin RatA of RatAB toxin-antitoxin module
MIKLTKNVVIAAPPEKAFDAVDNTANLPEVWRNLSNIRNLKRLPNGGHSFQFDYTMAGIRIEGSSVDLEHVRPHRIVTRTTGGIVSTLTWEFQPISEGAKTDLHLEAEYEAPMPVIGKLAEIVVAKINETDIVYFLNYLKLKLEGIDHKPSPG